MEHPHIEVPVPCSGSTHRVSWKAGEISLPDHDIETELTLAALHGDPPRCLQIFLSWRGSWTDLDAIALTGPASARRRFDPPTRHAWRRLAGSAGLFATYHADMQQRQWTVAHMPLALRALMGVSIHLGLGSLSRADDHSRHTGPTFPLGCEPQLVEAVRRTIPGGTRGEGGVAVFRAGAGQRWQLMGLRTPDFWAVTAFVGPTWADRVTTAGPVVDGAVVVDARSRSDWGPMVELVTWDEHEGVWLADPDRTLWQAFIS